MTSILMHWWWDCEMEAILTVSYEATFTSLKFSTRKKMLYVSYKTKHIPIIMVITRYLPK